MNLFRSTKTIPIATNPTNRSPLRRVLLFIALVIACFALSRAAQAQSCPSFCDSVNHNTAFGPGAFNGSSTGTSDSAFGSNALNANTTGTDNTATGSDALSKNTTGNNNTATGAGALVFNTTGSNDTATGVDALEFNTTGIQNTATGVGALTDNTTGSNDTATGADALSNNTTGNDNTATGESALAANTTGNNNTATGLEALVSNTTGISNTANGGNALFSNNASYGTATGFQALYFNTTGNYNTAEGYNALFNNTTGGLNTALGVNAGSNLTTGSGNVCIGASVVGVAGESNTTRIRNVYASTATARAVYVNSDNKIGVLSSSRRYKEEVKPMDKASETLFALKPVTFRYKKEVDPARMLSFGLISEEVANVSSDLITRDEEGNPQTVRYEAVNAMLLNEFLKEHRKVEELQAARVTEQKEITELKHQLKEQAAAIQKVSAQLEASKATPQIVASNTR